MNNQNGTGFQGQQGKTNNQIKDKPQAGQNAGQRDDLNKKNANAQGGRDQADKKNLSGSDSDSE